MSLNSILLAHMRDHSGRKIRHYFRGYTAPRYRARVDKVTVGDNPCSWSETISREHASRQDWAQIRSGKESVLLPRLRIRNAETVCEPWQMCQLMTGKVSFSVFSWCPMKPLELLLGGLRHKPAISRAETTGLEDGPKPRRTWSGEIDDDDNPVGQS